MKLKFKREKSKEELIKIHKLFFDILNEVKKYYVTKTINEEKEVYSISNFLDKYSNKNNYAFGLYKDSELIGFQLMYTEEGICFLEWTGVSNKHRRKGYAKYIEESLEKFLIKKTNVHKIVSDCLVINKESVFNRISNDFSIIAKLNNHWNKQDYYLWEKVIR